jgi:hypothetical protein
MGVTEACRERNRAGGAMISLWQRIKNEIVQDVPEEIALCEFDCNKAECTHEQWLACPRRLAYAARKLTPVAKGGTERQFRK